MKGYKTCGTGIISLIEMINRVIERKARILRNAEGETLYETEDGRLWLAVDLTPAWLADCREAAKVEEEDYGYQAP